MKINSLIGKGLERFSLESLLPISLMNKDFNEALFYASKIVTWYNLVLKKWKNEVNNAKQKCLNFNNLVVV